MDFFYTLTPNLRTFLGILVDLGSRSTLDKLGCLKCKKLEAGIEYFNICFNFLATVTRMEFVHEFKLMTSPLYTFPLREIIRKVDQ